MKSIARRIVIVFLLFFMMNGLCAKVVREYVLMQKEESINDKMFTHRSESDGDKRSELWMIEGVLVTLEQFEAAYLDERREEIRLERAQSVLRVEQEERSNRLMRRLILQKLIRTYLGVCREQVAIIEDNELSSFLVFSPQTIKDSMTYVALSQARLKEVEQLLEMTDADLEAIEQELLDSCSRLKLFVRATLNRAVEQCTDTKMLKKLLEVIE